MEAFADKLDGVLKGEAGGSRTFNFSAQSWAQMENELFKNFSTSASLLLVHLGHYYGTSAAKQAKLATNLTHQIFENLKAQVMAAGWGSLSIHWKEGDERNFEVEMKNCVFCAQESGVPSCNFFQGVLAGAASEIFGREYRIKETECLKKGADSCKFNVSLAEVRQSAGLFSAAHEMD